MNLLHPDDEFPTYDSGAVPDVFADHMLPVQIMSGNARLLFSTPQPVLGNERPSRLVTARVIVPRSLLFSIVERCSIAERTTSIPRDNDGLLAH